MAAPDLDDRRARNLEAVHGAFAGIRAGDATRQLEHYTEDLVLELPYASPPKRIDGKVAALSFLDAALGAFSLDLTIDEVHACLDPDELIVEFSGTGEHRPTGSPYANRYIAVFGFRDGRIARQREYYNPSASPTGGGAT